MLIAEACIPTTRARRYLIQLCRHVDKLSRVAHQLPPRPIAGAMPPRVEEVDCNDRGGLLHFAEGRVRMYATESALTLRVEAADRLSLQLLQQSITTRVHAMGRRDRLVVQWQDPETVPGRPGELNQSDDPVTESSSRRWRLRRRWAVLMTAGVLVALHLGLGGAALATAEWARAAGTIVLALVIGKVVLIGIHVCAGSYALRSSTDSIRCRRLRHGRPKPASGVAATAASAKLTAMEDNR